MNDQRMFADVDLPFHVWVREGRRWVLRETGAHRRAVHDDRGETAGSIESQPAATGVARGR